jgi:hypothetical protein
MRLSPALVEAAEKEGSIQKRSAPKQIEFWAELGKAVERVIDLADVFAIMQGLKKLKLEPAEFVAIEPDEVFAALEKDRKSGSLSEKVTSSGIYYEASRSRTGMLDRVNSITGARQTGCFRKGRFVAEKS